MDVKIILRDAVICLGASAAFGIAVDRILAWRKASKAWEAVEEYSYSEEDEEPWEEREYFEIPEGVNEVEPEKSADRASGPLYRKPDLSEMVDYTKFAAVQDDEAGKDEEPEGAFVHLISEEEFVRGTGNSDGYVSVTGTWFAQDHILAGWDNDLVEKDPATTVGEKAVEQFEDPDVGAVYVRNDLLKVLFEIVRSDEDFDLARQEVLKMEADEPYPGEV